MVSINTARDGADAALQKSSKEFNDQIASAQTKLETTQRNLSTIIESRFKEELGEVRETKKETVDAIEKTGVEANKAIFKEQGSIVGELQQDTPAKLQALQRHRPTN